MKDRVITIKSSKLTPRRSDPSVIVLSDKQSRPERARDREVLLLGKGKKERKNLNSSTATIVTRVGFVPTLSGKFPSEGGRKATSPTMPRIHPDIVGDVLHALEQCRANWEEERDGHRQKLYAILAQCCWIAEVLKAQPESWSKFIDHRFWASWTKRPQIGDREHKALRLVLMFVFFGHCRERKSGYARAAKYSGPLKYLLKQGTKLEDIENRLSASTLAGIRREAGLTKVSAKGDEEKSVGATNVPGAMEGKKRANPKASRTQDAEESDDRLDLSPGQTTRLRQAKETAGKRSANRNGNLLLEASQDQIAAVCGMSGLIKLLAKRIGTDGDFVRIRLMKISQK